VAQLPTLALIPLAAVAWWIVGFLPWVADGFGSSAFGQTSGLTIQWLAIPMFTGDIGGLVLGAGTGGLLIGLVALLGRDGPARSAVGAATGGALGMIVILVVTRAQLGDGNSAQGFSTDGRVVNGLTLIVVGMTVVGTLVGLLGLRGSLGLGVALAGLAGAAGVWTVEVLRAVGPASPGSYRAITDIGHWTGAAVLALALVTLGARPTLRLIAWPVAVLLAWFVAPTVTASSYIQALLRPGYGLPDRVGDTISAAAQVWRSASSPGARSLAPWIAAIVVAAVIVVARDLSARRTSDSAATDPSH
jgi:hypothetical protein